MLEFILEMIGVFITDVLLRGFIVFFRMVGAICFSFISFFRISPKKHFETESFDKKVGMFWTGFVFTILLSFIIWKSIFSCQSDMGKDKTKYGDEIIPNDIPVAFKENLTFHNQLIHKGIFSPDLKHYYYTLSDKGFTSFNVYVIEKLKEGWSKPQEAFFNSHFSEHGMSYSPNGESIFFSSTRPTKIDGIPDTWHIWKSDKINGKWTEPTYVDIPNLRDKLVSHPSITNDGTLYFHSSNLDYSEMGIYQTQQKNGLFENAKKTILTPKLNTGTCTPYVSPNEEYLIFASIGNHLNLMISFNDGHGNWEKTKRLNDKINNFGQGNPYVSPDGKFLFFTTGEHQKENWKVKWVNIESDLKKN